MIRCYQALVGLVAAGLVVFSVTNSVADSAAPDRPRPVGPAAQAGTSVNGLRLEVTARFIPEEEGWGSPKLEKTVTFHNETDATICLDGYSTYFRLVLAYISPSKMVQKSSLQPKIFCGAPIDEKSVIRIPAKGKHQFTDWGWCTSFSVPYGRIVQGQVVEDKNNQLFRLMRTGELTLAYAYRSDGPHGAGKYLQEYLAPGEKLWEGRVYSNPVTIHVSKLRTREEPKAK